MRGIYVGAIYAGANIVSAAVPFALLPLLTRLLDPAGYGHVVAFGLLITLCMPFAGLSVHSAVGVAWFNKPRGEIPAFNGTALTLILISTGLVAPAVAFLVELLPSLVAHLPAVWGTIAAVTAGANVILQSRLVLWQSQGKAWNNGILQVASTILNVGLSLAAVLILGWGAEGRNSGIALSSVVIALVAIALFMTSRDAALSFKPKFLVEQIRYGIPLVPHVLAGVILGTFDRWMVSTQLGPEALGLYGAAAQLGMVMSILADAFVKAYNPWLYARLASTERSDRIRVVGAVYIAFPAFLALAIGVGLFLRFAGGIFLGLRFAEAAAHLLPWFLLGGAFSGLYFGTSSIYFFAGRTGLLASCSFTAALIGAPVVWLLVATLGVQGGAIGFAVTQALLAMFVTVLAFKTFDLPWFEFRRAIGSVLLHPRYSSPLNAHSR